MASDLVAVESRLWANTNQLWGNTGIKLSEFSARVLGLILLRYADQSFTGVTALEAKADYLLTNPPCNNSDWRGEPLNDDRRRPYDMPPAGNANFASRAAA